MKTKELKRNKGITLIALVITIIVLLILVGITITTLTGENGIISNTAKAKEETRGSAVEEARDTWRLNQQIDSNMNDNTAQTLEELLDDLEEQKLITAEERKDIEETGKVTIGSREIQFKELTLKEQLQIGDYVNYSTNTTSFNIEDILPDSKSTVQPQTFSTEEDMKWRVLKKVDENTLLLISDKPTTVQFDLGGIEGYNFGVNILDETCRKLYSNKGYYCAARNIKLSDIEKMLKEETLKELKETPNSENVSYGEKIEYTENIYYPSLFEYEMYGEIDNENMEDGINNEEYMIVNDRIGKANTSLKIIQTGYNTRELTKEDFKNEISYELLFCKENKNFNTNFFVSTRTITADSIGDEKYAAFGIGLVITRLKQIHGESNYYESRTSSYKLDNLFISTSGAFRPVVEVYGYDIDTSTYETGRNEEGEWQLLYTPAAPT